MPELNVGDKVRFLEESAWRTNAAAISINIHPDRVLLLSQGRIAEALGFDLNAELVVEGLKEAFDDVLVVMCRQEGCEKAHPLLSLRLQKVEGADPWENGLELLW